MSTEIQTVQAAQILMDGSIIERVANLASIMATAGITIPKHLSGNKGDCFAIAMQSMQWGMNPFAVAQKTHLVNGILGYEAQLINAVIISRAPIINRPNYEWYGNWENVDGKTCKAHDVGVRVYATIKGESEPRVLDLPFSCVGSVRNSPNWVNDPRQQIAYLALKRWSRLHTPDVILGVYSADEIEDTAEIDVTPTTEYVKPEMTFYPQADFDKNFGKWEQAILDGKKDAQSIINMIESKAKLTDEQKQEIVFVEVKKNSNQQITDAVASQDAVDALNDELNLFLGGDK